jgi:hypothetical protein
MAESYSQIQPDSTGNKIRTETSSQGGNTVHQQVVSLADAGGTLLGLASTSAQTSVSAATSSTSLLSANSARLGASVYNDSTAICYLLLGSGTASTTAYSVQLAAGAYYEVPFGYTGAIKGIWSAANGSARIMEYTA